MTPPDVIERIDALMAEMPLPLWAVDALRDARSEINKLRAEIQGAMTVFADVPGEGLVERCRWLELDRRDQRTLLALLATAYRDAPSSALVLLRERAPWIWEGSDQAEQRAP